MTTLMQMPDGRLIRACFLFLFFNSVSFAFFLCACWSTNEERETTTATFFFFLLWREFEVVSPLPFSLSLSGRVKSRVHQRRRFSRIAFLRVRMSTTHPHTISSENLFSSLLHSAFWKKKHNRAANRLVKRGHGHFPRQRPTNFKHQRVHGYCWYHTHDARSSRIR